MTHSEQMDAVRATLSELHQAQITTALCLSRLQELTAVDDPTHAVKDVLPQLEESSFSVTWKRRKCHLGHTKSFRILARLVRRANHYVSYDHLLRDAWGGDRRSPDTVRSAVRELKGKLLRAGMGTLASAIQGQGQHYGLILDERRR